MPEKPRVVIDTQVFLRAAINRKSLPARVIFDLNHRYELITATPIIAEVRDVLFRPKLRERFSQLTDEIANNVLALLHETMNIELENIPEVSRDVKDDMFIACAIAGSAQFIVSEDKDLLVLHPYQEIHIVNVFDFFNILST